ncbi:MFP1 attachment factor 1-like [Juglans microcarpa x Juglans regia]|uniref:MFP1 attachment factor 1-like n=1 Tax=Juglans microcarpa x Juglans regia TaxID=2249226 RepID=UPI001B7F0307|nr:MFP1 attachment factor 1-like [Juglans microcarpa x Juglans regia]
MSDSEITPASPPPAVEMEAQPQEKPHQEPSKKPRNNSLTFSIWPPTERTREAVVNRLIDTLSTVSVLSKRYGTLPHDEAAAVARIIEDEAFSAASASASADDDGIEILQVYSREISSRMLETVKSRGTSGSTADTALQTSIPSVVPATTNTTEENTPAETES